MDKVTELASVFHDEWRKPRQKPDGTYEPRLKDDGVGGQCDIANTIYPNLPEKWQLENKAAAIVLVELFNERTVELIKAHQDDPVWMGYFVELTSAKVHSQWSVRNSWSDLAKVKYEELSNEEQEKDRAQVRAAMKILL